MKVLLDGIFFCDITDQVFDPQSIYVSVVKGRVTYNLNFMTYDWKYYENNWNDFTPTEKFKQLTFPDILSDYPTEKFVFGMDYNESHPKDLNFALKIFGKLRPAVNIAQMNGCTISSGIFLSLLKSIFHRSFLCFLAKF